MDLHKCLPSKLFEPVERAGICTTKQILTLSQWDLQKKTNLASHDINLLVNLTAELTCPKSSTGDEVYQRQSIILKIPTGCTAIDSLLAGGLQAGTITEVYGESGSGKTQIALQIAAQNCDPGIVYINTEDMFPIKRFQEIVKSLPNYNPNKDYGNQIYLEHVIEATDLLSCLRVRLPKLLETNVIKVIIVDSIAAPFRCETFNYIQRAEELREVAILLLTLAQKYNFAVLCLNQVSSSLQTESILPSLGLAWSNMVSVRLHVKKTWQAQVERNNVQVRSCTVVFSPYLANCKADFVITSNGVESLPPEVCKKYSNSTDDHSLFNL